MPYGQRLLVGTGGGAEGDKLYGQYVFQGTSGTLTIGMPLYVADTDAAEFNNRFTGATGTSLTPATAATGGGVVLGTAGNVGANPICVGVFQPDNYAALPNNGDTVKVQMWGRAIVSAQSPAAGSAGVVGGNVIVSTTVVQVVPGARAAGLNVGMLLATRAVVTTGATLFAAASATVALYNMFVALT